jgi:hypothetical protein
VWIVFLTVFCISGPASALVLPIYVYRRAKHYFVIIDYIVYKAEFKIVSKIECEIQRRLEIALHHRSVRRALQCVLIEKK